MDLKKSNVSHRILPKGLGWCHQSNHIGPRAYAWLSEHGADLEIAGAWFDNTIDDKEVTPEMGKKLRAHGDEGDPIVIESGSDNELFVDQNLNKTAQNSAITNVVTQPLSRSAQSSLWGHAFLSGESYDCQNMTPTEASEFARWSGIHGESARQTTEELNMVYAVGSQDGDQESKHDEESDYSTVDSLSSSEDSQRANYSDARDSLMDSLLDEPLRQQPTKPQGSSQAKSSSQPKAQPSTKKVTSKVPSNQTLKPEAHHQTSIRSSLIFKPSHHKPPKWHLHSNVPRNPRDHCSQQLSKVHCYLDSGVQPILGAPRCKLL
ncbi:hypothetical protein MYU51_010099 [Penicillium brevicompactum]